MSVRDATGLSSRARAAVWAAETLRGEGGGAGRAMRAALRPAGVVAGLVARVRARATRPAPGTAPFVVAVGGLTLGGAGKTPLVARLAQDVATAGLRPTIVSRGYGGRTARETVRAVGPADAGADVGDEPVLLARALALTTQVIVARDRPRGIALAHAIGGEVVLLDDAFQTRGVERHVDVVALDARTPFGTGRVLPAGDLREPPAGLARAAAVVLTRVERATPDEIDRTLRLVRAQAPRAMIATARHVPAIRSGPPLAGRRVWIVSGVADPHSVEATVRALGGEPVGHTAAPDHHAFSDDEWAQVLARAARRDAEALVLTDKDAARARGDQRALFPIPSIVVGVDLAWESGGDVLLERVAAGARGVLGRGL